LKREYNEYQKLISLQLDIKCKKIYFQREIGQKHETEELYEVKRTFQKRKNESANRE
jgi:hypothetical protein